MGLGGSGGTAKPEWVKPKRAERKKRKQSFVRKRDIPTREIRHAVETCPACGRRLSGGWLHSRRQTIEIPKTPVEIIEHVLIARRCGVCEKIHIPKLGIADGVIGTEGGSCYMDSRALLRRQR